MIPARRRLNGGEIALIVVVSVLVLVFLGMLVGRLGGTDGGSRATTATSATADDAMTPPADGVVVDLADVAWSFRLPSGNIGCAMGVERVLCAIDSFDYQPPEIPGCPGETGVAFRIDAGGTAPLCTTGSPSLSEVRELPYGESVTAGEFTCTSSETGVACRNGIGHEITLRRATFGL